MMDKTENEFLPMRIIKMVKLLHDMGYTSLYIWCGMSPSGMNWRYLIGEIVDGKWPSEKEIVRGSLRPDSTVEWSARTSTAEELADGFISAFAKNVSRPYSPNDYTRWYANLVDSLGYNELLAFYADYEAKHERLLREAPMFCE
jgi:hypothetical protein